MDGHLNSAFILVALTEGRISDPGISWRTKPILLWMNNKPARLIHIIHPTQTMMGNRLKCC